MCLSIEKYARLKSLLSIAALPIQIAKHCRSKPEAGDGSRLLVTRYWPRGVTKGAFDEWRRELAPSPELLSSYRQAVSSIASNGDSALNLAEAWTWFADRYRHEMSHQAAPLAELRGRLMRGEVLTLLCACHENSQCHRSILAELLIPPEPGQK